MNRVSQMSQSKISVSISSSCMDLIRLAVLFLTFPFYFLLLLIFSSFLVIFLYLLFTFLFLSPFLIFFQCYFDDDFGMIFCILSTFFLLAARSKQASTFWLLLDLPSDRFQQITLLVFSTFSVPCFVARVTLRQLGSQSPFDGHRSALHVTSPSLT